VKRGEAGGRPLRRSLVSKADAAVLAGIRGGAEGAVVGVAEEKEKAVKAKEQKPRAGLLSSLLPSMVLKKHEAPKFFALR
jgi:hypothetical protein